MLCIKGIAKKCKTSKQQQNAGQPFTISRLLNRFKYEGASAAPDVVVLSGAASSRGVAVSFTRLSSLDIMPPCFALDSACFIFSPSASDTTKVQTGLTRRDTSEAARKEKSFSCGLLFLESNT